MTIKSLWVVQKSESMKEWQLEDSNEKVASKEEIKSSNVKPKKRFQIV